MLILKIKRIYRIYRIFIYINKNEDYYDYYPLTLKQILYKNCKLFNKHNLNKYKIKYKDDNIDI